MSLSVKGRNKINRESDMEKFGVRLFAIRRGTDTRPALYRVALYKWNEKADCWNESDAYRFCGEGAKEAAVCRFGEFLDMGYTDLRYK
jgi:hypothetical protein